MKRWILALIALAGLSLAATAEPGKIVLLLTNVDRMNPGVADNTPGAVNATGFYLSEAAHPYAVFKEAGYEVVFASPEGGFAPVDPKSLDFKDKKNEAFWESHKAKQDGRLGIKGTTKLSSLKPADFVGIYAAGGHGTCWDFPNNEDVASFISTIYANGGVVGAVCHGPTALVGVMGADGKPLVSGKKVAVFTNAEEKAVKLDKVVPFLLETKLEEAGADVQVADNWAVNAVRDGRLVTGQNPASATKSAELFVEALKDAAKP